MNKNENQKQIKPVNTNDLAGRQFKSEDYKNSDEVSQGLAETHEQMSDTYQEGTVEDTNR
ncbi:YozQ family protein [Priestia flexa]|uniref:YozQ family protein n=1 Tax=Priestia flexa TaxID=86664 RepID=UPI001B31ADB5|nr:YozQ family protein [Priestia flexa]